MSAPRPAPEKGHVGRSPGEVTVAPVDGIGEVREGDDLAALLGGAVDLLDGDVLVVTSKVVSKSEGRVVRGPREEALAGETDRTVAWRGRTSIVRTHHGLVMAAAGIDGSNTDPDTSVLLPLDPDASARRLREALAHTTGRNVAVLVTDTSGRAWRNGQTDIAIGAAGLHVLHDYAGRTDPHGNELVVTSPAVADELAAAGDLVKRKLDRRPAAVVRGLADLVLAPGSHGPGASALVREESSDMFGLGSREAVLAALHQDDDRGFGGSCSAAELVVQLSALVGAEDVVRPEDGGVSVSVRGDGRAAGAAEQRVRTAAFALRWRETPGSRARTDPAAPLRFEPASP